MNNLPVNIHECPVCIVESEIHMMQALEDVKKAGCHALAVQGTDCNC